MGAVAISTLAGTSLMLNTSHFPFLQGIFPSVQGFTLFFWATGTWWIPMLVILGIWRHFYKGFKLTYDISIGAPSLLSVCIRWQRSSWLMQSVWTSSL
jgi:hypothetical protein